MSAQPKRIHKCTECGAEIIAILPTLAPASADVICLECSGASIDDFFDDGTSPFEPRRCYGCGDYKDEEMCPNCDY